MKPLLPTIDIQPYLADPSSSEAAEVIEAVRAACLNSGFFQITGHGIPESLQQDILTATANLYNLTLEEKLKLEYTKNIGHRGYALIGAQKYDDITLPDLKESFLLGHDHSLDDPRVVARRFFMGPNVWPPLPEKDFKQPVNAYFNALYNLTVKLIGLIARTLPYGPNIFEDFVQNDPVAPLRLLHYPPQRVDDKEQLGASAHTDFGAITLLLQDKNAGLEIFDAETKQWILVPPKSNTFVVNIGDMLSMWTGGLYKSSLHRVLNKSDNDRYSVAFFFDGNLDCKLDPLSGTKLDAPSFTCEQYMIKRMTETYGGRGGE